MRQVEFRDGYKLVPDHVADKLAEFETYKMTYEQALDKMNSSFVEDRLRKAQNDVVREHLTRFGIE